MFSRALLVNKDFFNLLSEDIRLPGGVSVRQVLRERQEVTLDAYIELWESEHEYQYSGVPVPFRLLTLRAILGHIWNDFERARSDLKFIERIYNSLTEEESLIFLASLHRLFGSTGELVKSSRLSICRDGAPCIYNDLKRHRMILSVRTLHFPGFLYDVTGIYQISALQDEDKKDSALDCCQDLWGQIGRSGDWWTMFGQFEESDLVRVLSGPGTTPGPRYLVDCYFVQYERRIFYRVCNGLCERLDDIWDHVPRIGD